MSQILQKESAYAGSFLVIYWKCANDWQRFYAEKPGSAAEFINSLVSLQHQKFDKWLFDTNIGL